MDLISIAVLMFGVLFAVMALVIFWCALVLAKRADEDADRLGLRFWLHDHAPDYRDRNRRY